MLYQLSYAREASIVDGPGELRVRRSEGRAGDTSRDGDATRTRCRTWRESGTSAPSSRSSYARLRRSILDGSLAPGARLRYRQLAEQFGVSVTPVRVALKELAGEGLVELRPHAGASVSALSVEELEEVLLTRTSLEPFLALHGAEHLTDDDLAEMSGAPRRGAGRDPRARPRRVPGRVLGAPVDRLPGRESPAAPRPRRHALRPVSPIPPRQPRRHATASRGRSSYMEAFHDACVARDGARAQRVMREALEWTLAYLVEAL